MYVHRANKIVYLAHPRTASMSMFHALTENGFEVVGQHHSTLFCDGSPVTEKNRSEWTVFTTIRNHWDTAVSWVLYRHGGRNPVPIQWSIKALEFNMSPKWISADRMWGLHGDDADRVLRFESIQADFDFFMDFAGLSRIQLKRHNVTSGRNGAHYSKFYTDEMRDYIKGRFRKEIEFFGYKYEKPCFATFGMCA